MRYSTDPGYLSAISPRPGEETIENYLFGSGDIMVISYYPWESSLRIRFLLYVDGILDRFLYHLLADCLTESHPSLNRVPVSTLLLAMFRTLLGQVKEASLPSILTS
ncbi:hypothetical protein PAXRUDRAFT_831093 [Paxillus rubicundulus Ve08.2h10]|uniref:Uncharacterized protein n=1 Tax=Paxillus rubicundulus Ve08.2h10 TaxID=930991 RepID=A0A0D0DSI9_9AGAM|nr:hypothetical protein PAXRUDRAFT_831093 [Paxillus rubicundulus Ve08.2h10]